MKKIFLILIFSGLLFTGFSQEQTPTPPVDSNLVELFNQLIQNLDGVINNVQEIKQDSPGGPVSPEGVTWWQSLIYVFSTVLLPYLLRKMSSGSKVEQIIGFLGKIKNNGVLAIVSAGLVVIVGLVGFQGQEDTLTTNEIITYFTSVFGWSSIVYILMNWATGGGAKTPKPAETNEQ